MSKITTFKKLSSVDLSKKVEKKNGLAYVSWADAWHEVKTLFPNASYCVDHYNDKPYLYDDNLGYMVSTTVTIDNQTLPMHLPVMDGANKSMKATAYSYKTKYGDKYVNAASMFDINKTIMRCLVKNLAMFGLGLYIYAGEDLPISEPEPIKKVTAPNVKQVDHARQTEIISKLADCNDMESLVELSKAYKDDIGSYPSIKLLFTRKKNDIQKAA